MCATMQKLRMCSSFNGCLWVVREAAEGPRNITVKRSFPGARKKKEDCSRSPLSSVSSGRAYCAFGGGAMVRTGSVFCVVGAARGGGGGGGGGVEGRSRSTGADCLGGSAVRVGGGDAVCGSGRSSRNDGSRCGCCAVVG